MTTADLAVRWQAVRAAAARALGWPSILREPEAAELATLLAPLLGPRVGLRARASVLAEPRWTLTSLDVEAHRGAKEVRNLGCMLRALREADQRKTFAARDYAAFVERS